MIRGFRNIVAIQFLFVPRYAYAYPIHRAPTIWFYLYSFSPVVALFSLVFSVIPTAHSISIIRRGVAPSPTAKPLRRWPRTSKKLSLRGARRLFPRTNVTSSLPKTDCSCGRPRSYSFGWTPRELVVSTRHVIHLEPTAIHPPGQVYRLNVPSGRARSPKNAVTLRVMASGSSQDLCVQLKNDRAHSNAIRPSLDWARRSRAF